MNVFSLAKMAEDFLRQVKKCTLQPAEKTLKQKHICSQWIHVLFIARVIFVYRVAAMVFFFFSLHRCCFTNLILLPLFLFLVHSFAWRISFHICIILSLSISAHCIYGSNLFIAVFKQNTRPTLKSSTNVIRESRESNLRVSRQTTKICSRD